jgi:hypothetical protein
MSDTNPDGDYPVERIALWHDPAATFGISIPENALLVKSPHVGKPYLEWRNSSVQIFLQDDDPGRFAGTRVIAKICVMKKRWADGREGLYIDLGDVQEAVQGVYPTHAFAVHGRAGEKKERPIVFETALEGAGTVLCVYDFVLRKKPKS